MDTFRHQDIWQVWGYPQDETWDGFTFDIGYTTDSGTGSYVAQGLDVEDAYLIVEAVQKCSALKRENLALRAILMAAGIPVSTLLADYRREVEQTTGEGHG